MATTGMQNLNSPATQPGQLSEAELRDWWPPRRGDMVGIDIDAIHRRAPAEAATEVGQDDDFEAARGIVYAVPAALLAWAVIALVAVIWKVWA